MEKVCVLGLGYIGLPTGILLAESGYEVTGVDIDVQRVHEINNGNPVIHEPEIYEKLQFVLGSNQFHAATEIEEADYFIIAVPTPITKEKKADLSYVFTAADSIAGVLQKSNVVIIESTIPVGSTKQVTEFLEQKSGLKVGIDFFVAYCPERVLPGNTFHELVSNDRIIGGINQQSLAYAKQLYKSFVDGYLYLTDAQTAEMVKLVENSSRDTELAFAHQVASMAYSIGLNPYEVIKLANKHPRVNILQPTCGVGGHCLAVDPWFLVESFPQHTQLIKKVRETNDNKPIEVINCIVHTVNEWRKQNTGVCTVLLLGATYKPDIDDLRESPALKIIQNLINDHSDIHVLVTEPHVPRDILNQYCANRIVSTIDGIAQANIIVFLVGHKRFKVLDRKLLDGKQILDFCGVLYEYKKDNKQYESMFWPARSMMDFFIVNQPNSEQIKGDT